MPSPFPGMDPYLESPAIWPGFHTRLCVQLANTLGKQLPIGFVALLDQYVWLAAEADTTDRIRFKPDSYIVPTGSESEPNMRQVGGGSTTCTKPTEVMPYKHPNKPKQRYVTILDRVYGKVVTVIEILSPANKNKGPNGSQYLAKRRTILGAETHLVELDFLRGVAGIGVKYLKAKTTDYTAVITKFGAKPSTALWAFDVKDTAPTLPIPFDDKHSDIAMNLQSCLAAVYEDGNYDRLLDYTQPADPPLEGDDALWANQLIQSHLATRKKS